VPDREKWQSRFDIYSSLPLFGLVFLPSLCHSLPKCPHFPSLSLSLVFAIETRLCSLSEYITGWNSYKYKTKLPLGSSLSAHKRGRLPRTRHGAEQRAPGVASFAWFLDAAYKLMRRMGGGKSSRALGGVSLFKQAIFHVGCGWTLSWATMRGWYSRLKQIAPQFPRSACFSFPGCFCS